MRKLAVLALIAMVSALAAGALSANAAKVKKVKTTVTINYKPGTYGDSFDGKVKSKKKKCRKGRKVTVKYVQPGSDPTIGSDKSNSKGKWKVDAGGFADPGKYYAIAKKKKKGKIVCKKGKSPKVTVP